MVDPADVGPRQRSARERAPETSPWRLMAAEGLPERDPLATATLALLLALAPSCGPAAQRQDEMAAAPPAVATRAGGPPGPVRAATTCVVTRIVDGDTIDCDGVGRVRLIGMDTPERGQGRIAALATEALTRMIPVGSSVAVEPDVEPRDRDGRVLGYVWADGTLVNWALVRHGWAVVLTYPPNVQYVDWFTAAQEAARADSAGLWAIDGFSCTPRDYRARRC